MGEFLKEAKKKKKLSKEVNMSDYNNLETSIEQRNISTEENIKPRIRSNQ